MPRFHSIGKNPMCVDQNAQESYVCGKECTRIQCVEQNAQESHVCELECTRVPYVQNRMHKNPMYVDQNAQESQESHV